MRDSRRIIILKGNDNGVFLLIYKLIKCGGLDLYSSLDSFNFSSFNGNLAKHISLGVF